ncbi:quinone oxidoreductase family protein [Actinocorallia sp. A-T 12471]|uniref:quinone oxidoreductase family protein n=1 Tax=Actinocorallia sp. A-T 12471 TaxID=3089813 RepID=UPI0029D1583E|nr:zinc-binding dehydrogenase [Actinocorallia sp. A-T 12471]MDX6742401.1 zinc-binding dehydrogenase [Actinocorallia sp. A-T 12471]
MRGLLVRRFGAPPEPSEGLTEPERAPGSSLVRMAAVTLGHLDRSVASGTFPRHPEPPYVPCGDGAGHIVESDAFPEGTLVWIRGAGLGVDRDGLAAELVAVPDEALHPAPDGTDPALAACFFSPATSAHLAVHELAGVGAGSRVLVTGAAGAVGSLAVQLARRAGAEVTGLVSRPERAALVPEGTRVLHGDADDGPYDVLIETVGGPGLATRLDAVAPGGVAVVVGYTAGTKLELDLPSRCVHDVDLRFLNMIRRAPQAFALADGLLADLSGGGLSLRVDRRPLADAAAAWADLAAGRARGRVVLELPR